MRVTFVLPQLNRSGGVRVLASLSHNLQRRGHQVFVVALPRRKPTLREQLRSLRRGAGWMPYQRNAPSHFDGTGVPSRVIERARPIADADVPDADVVVATWWETAEWVARLAPAKGARAYFIQGHETFVNRHKARAAATYSLPLHKIVVSAWLAELMRAQYGDSEVSRVTVGVDGAVFYAPPRTKRRPPTVGMVYARAPWKGAEVGLRAFSLAAQTIPDLRLVAFGSQKPLPGHALPPGTEFHELPEEQTIRQIYASCDVWLCSSWSEGFGLPPLEALACRCPVVATRVGALPEFVAEGVNGYLTPPGEAGALARRLADVIALPEAEWAQMSEAACQTAARYDWETATDQFEAALAAAIQHAERDGFSAAQAGPGA